MENKKLARFSRFKINDNDLILFIIQNYDETMYFKIPPKEINSEVFNILFGNPIYGNSYYFNVRMICHKYFGFGLDEGFTLINNINDNEKKLMSTILEKPPIFLKYRLGESFMIEINDKAFIVILNPTVI